MKEKIRVFSGIRFKVAMFICLAAFMLIVIGMSVGYYFSFNLLHGVVGDGNERLAKVMASSVSTVLDRKISDIRTYLADIEYIQAIKEANLKYQGMGPEDIKKYLMDMDKQWIGAEDNSQLLSGYIHNTAGMRLNKIQEEDNNIAEIFLTDKYGGLVASSRRTTDFYQSDEEWWQSSFNGGRGKVFVGEIEFHQSANIIAVSLALPVRDEAEELIGISKVVLNIKTFCAFLEKFKIGNTGHAVLIDENGNILYHPDFKLLNTKYNENEEFNKLLKDAKTLGRMRDPHVYMNGKFITFAPVTQRNLSENGLTWWFIIEQDPKEVFAPLNTLLFQGILLAPFMILLSIPLGFILGGIFVKPIKRLQHAAEEVGKGNLDIGVVSQSKDEIGELSREFNKMTRELKESTTSIDKLSKEIYVREKIQEALYESEKRFKGLVSNIPGAVYQSANDPEKTMQFISDAIDQISGYPASDFIANHIRSYAGIIHYEDKGMANAEVQKGISSKKPYIIEYRIVHKDGGIRWVYEKGQPAFDDKGNVAYLYGAIFDITERKKAEEALRDINLINQALVESIPFPMDIVDGQCNVLFMNDLMKENVGNQFEGKKCWWLYTDEKKQCENCPLKLGIRVGETKIIEVAGVFGGRIFEITHAGMIYHGRKAILEIFQDVTERRQVENLKTEFVNTVSHELRTPLSIIKEGINLVFDEVTGKLNEKQHEVLRISKDGIDRLSRIINDLLDISRIEAGKVELRKDEVNLNVLIKSMAEYFISQASEKNIELKTDLPEEPINIYADKDRLSQVFINLIGNAIKFTNEGHIDIYAADKGGYIECSVSDTGIGIAKENIPYVFEKFRQFGRGAGGGIKGTGLGLSIVKGIINTHKGDIKVESQLTKGTKFIFTLPKYSLDQLFEEQLSETVIKASKKSQTVALLSLSVSGLDLLLGEFQADKLKDISAGFEKALRDILCAEEDIIARDAGEMIIILQDCDKGDTVKILPKFEGALKKYIDSINLGDRLKIKSKCITYPDEVKTLEELIGKVRIS